MVEEEVNPKLLLPHSERNLVSDESKALAELEQEVSNVPNETQLDHSLFGVFGDADGVVVVTQSRAEEVLRLAQVIEGVEEQIRSAIETGMRLDEARKRYGYHTLQRRQTIEP